MDPSEDEEEAWCAERRAHVADYLRRQKLQHGEIGEVPAWFVAPITSIWAVESIESPGWVGWWVVSGDLPADYCSAEGCRHPRLALKRIAARWNEEIAHTEPNDDEIGSLGLPIALLPLLQGRAQALLEISNDDSEWAD